MKTLLLRLTMAILLCPMFITISAQAPDLGAATSFAVFTGVGAFTNDGATFVTGDIGTNAGMFSGFPPGVVVGTIHVANAVSTAASIAVADAYSDLAGLTCGQVIGVGLGNGQILTPNIYCTGAATTINGTLILDAQNDPNAIFIFQIGGALSTGTLAQVVLINGASLCNVWWQINGAFSLGEGSVFRGNALVNGAISLLEGSSVIGRALATVGAVDLHNNLITIGLPAVAPVITSNVLPEICAGDSVILAGNIDGTWSTGETTATITVSTSGDFYVVNTSVCGNDTSNHIIVTVNALPICTISGSTSICEGSSTELCAPAGALLYVWSTGATTSCITVSTAGLFSVTVTDALGCTSECSVTVTVTSTTTCSITGSPVLCIGQSTELCVPAGAASYLWSNGATTNCITVTSAGLYSVTITSVGGCVSTCSQIVTLSPVPLCIISGGDYICEGGSIELCALIGYESYLWNTGETSNCLTVSAPGIYSVTVTHTNGCTSTCSQTITVSPSPICLITGENVICAGQSTELCVALQEGVFIEDYWWNTGNQTNCITIDSAGTYAVTVTDENGCTSVCDFTVTENPVAVCTIVGETEICVGESTQLCTPAGAAAYLWSNGATVNCITVNVAGTYSVTVTDQNGCTNICTHIVTVNPLPLCSITGNLFLCQEGQSTQLCATAGASSYLWSTGATSACITVNSAGIYSVTITDVNGCTSVCSETVVLDALPVCTITGDVSICLGLSTVLCVPAGALSYLWSTGEVTNCISVSVAGTYAVSVTSVDGCVSTCSTVVSVNPLPVCAITGDAILCQGESSELCAPAGASAYLWSTGAITACITVTLAGTYSVTMTDINGCVSVCSQLVTVNPLPVCLISGDNVLCLGESTQLCVAAGAAAYAWSNGAITSCITVNIAGLYSVTITDINGCTSECSQLVSVNPLPVCLITGDNVLCLGGSTELCVAAGAASYLWSNGAVSACITVSLEGTYSVTITDTNGCTSVCSQIVTVAELPACVITCDNLLCLGESTQLCVPAGAASYLWSNGATLNCISVSIAGVYSVTITEVDGCISVCSITVSVNPLPVCSITGANIPCEGASTELCAFPGGLSYIWSTGQTSSCISVSVAGTYFVTVTDANGCSSVCSRVVIVNPTTAPAITCPVDVTIDCDDSTLPANTGNATATGNCNLIPTISFVDVNSPGLCPQEFSITRTWTASYPGGLSSVCTQLISVVDNTAPVMICPPDVTIACNESQLPANTGLATATDNCGVVVTIAFSDVASGLNCPLMSVITRTWTATDQCGNSNSCLQNISVLDNTPPAIEIVNPLLSANGDTTYIQCYGQDPLWDLPLFDENSVVATDLCAGEVNVAYSQVLLNEGDCEEDGYIILFRLTWTATDLCGNSSSAFVFLALIDTIAPVIHGVPGDTTVNCSDIPELPTLVYATDECLCACIVLAQETELPAGCQNGGVLVRTWTATDRCGNETIVTQRITLVDDQGPALVVIEPDMSGMVDGYILEYTCSAEGTLRFLELLDEESVSGIGSCGGGEVSMSLRVTSEDALNCEFLGYVEQQTYVWTAVDECGITSTFTLIARLVDNEAPKLVGIPEVMTCIGGSALRNIYATDNCEEAYTQYWDVNIPNPCGTGMAVRRTYEATDDCGNASRATVILIPNDFTAPVLVIDNAQILALDEGEVLVINCEATAGHYTTFSATDVHVDDPCAAGVVVTFTERLMSTEDCASGEVVATVELKWQATDACGNSSEHLVIAHVVDDSNPVFVNFQPSMTIGCHDAMPEIVATDNCGEVTIVSSDSTILGDCVYEYDIRRIITATDPCGNQTTRTQMVHVGNGGGPVIAGVREELCDDLTIPVVTAYDACAEVFVDVTMTQDTLDVDCRDGLVIRRTWSAVDVCGNVSVIEQTIVTNDTTGPVILIPTASFLHDMIEHHIDLMFFSQEDLIALIDAFNERSVIVIDACDEDIIPVLTVNIEPGDCLEDGWSERRTYTWVATDVCGNSASISVIIHLIDDVPPQLPVIDADTTIVCVPLPEALIMTFGALDGVIINYVEVQTPGSNPNEIIVTRTWTATDSCGNTSSAEQVITWIPESYLECEVLLPDSVDCNSHGVIIGSIVTGGFGGYLYEWEVFGEKCFIQGGQGTPEIDIYVGWGDVKIILTVTDSFGCVTMCMAVLSCDLTQIPLTGFADERNPAINNAPVVQILDDPFEISIGEPLQLSVWPNPTTGKITLNFDSPTDQEIQWTLTNFLGQEVLNDKFNGVRGMNIHETNLEHLKPGSYLLQVKTVQGIRSQIVVIIPEK